MGRGTLPAVIAVLAGCAVARGPSAAPGGFRVDLVVVAPHPDDETLTAAGVLASAVRAGKRVAVVVVTNGDYSCERDGYARQAETIAAMRQLGIAEDDVTFLGYPDGHLADLGDDPLAPVERRGADGACTRGGVTYGARGRGRTDAHTARTGRPATYTAASLEEDLGAELARLAPSDVYVTHGIDSHPDHATTYAFVRRALEARTSGTPPVLHRAIVHAGPCWPNGRQAYEPCPAEPFDPAAPVPPLPDPLASYVPRERVAVPAEMRRASAAENAKLHAIAAYPTQAGPDPVHDWLASFARADEAFYPEILSRGTCGASASVVANCPHLNRVPPIGRSGAVTVEGTRAGPYSLQVADDGSHVELRRDVESGAPRALRRFRLPDDHTRGAAHRYSLRVDPRPDDGPVVEVTVRRDERFLGVVVDTADDAALRAAP